MHYTIGCLLGWIAGSLIVGIIAGSLIWFVGSIFGASWDYFSYIRGWVFGILIFDGVIRTSNYMKNL